jgi:hypothetical protein
MHKIVLKYYIFDWDDNILHMPTIIHMVYNGVSKDITTAQFAKIKNKPGWVRRYDFIDEFMDKGPRGNDAFITDIKDAIERKSFGPCWNTFINAIINGEIFLIVTARGHSSNTLKSAVRNIIYDQLTKQQLRKMYKNVLYLAGLYHTERPNISNFVDVYLDYCDFIGVSSPDFENKFGLSKEKTEYAKELIVRSFIDKINENNSKIGYKITIGFSDDDKDNIRQISNFIQNKSNWENIVSFSVYDTSNPKKIKKKTLYEFKI